MEATALQHAGRRGLLARRSPLLKLQGDEKLVALVRDGNASAFDAIVDRYQARLLGFCRQMLHSQQDAEDVLQEVFVNAYRAMLADERDINLRPWLYRIARNRCLNHLRKPSADAKESMDEVPIVEAASTAERVHNREEFRQLLGDVQKLPETQRTALLLREMDAMSYEDIAKTMDTTVASVKSLLVRARISLAEASKARLLTCGEVRLDLAEAAEGLGKASPEVRRHVRDCPECEDFRKQLRSDGKVLAALSPIGPLVAIKAFVSGKLGFGGGSAAGSGAAGASGSAAAGAAGAGAGVASAGGTLAAGGAIAGGSAGGGLSVIGGAVGAKAVAGVVTAAVLTAGAVEVRQNVITDQTPAPSIARVVPSISDQQVAPIVRTAAAPVTRVVTPPVTEPTVVVPDPAPLPVPETPVTTPVEDPAVTDPEVPVDPEVALDEVEESVGAEEADDTGTSTATTTTTTHPSGGSATVTVGDPPAETTPTPPPATTPPPPAVQAPLPPVTPPASSADTIEPVDPPADVPAAP